MSKTRAFPTALNLTFVILSIIFPTASFSRDPIPTPPGFRIGIELELQPVKLANLTSYFDFQKLSKNEHILKWMESADLACTSITGQDLTVNFLRDNPSALQSLPAEIRVKLTEGLKLESNLIARKNEILDSSGKSPLEKRPGLITGDAPVRPAARTGLILPGNGGATAPLAAIPPDLGVDERLFQKASNGLTITNNAALNVVNQRWAAIPLTERSGLVLPFLDKLGPIQKAFLAVQAGKQLRLREDLTAEAKELFKPLSWHPDGTTLEFIHQESDPALFVHDPETFLKQARLLAQRAGVERQVFDPQAVRDAAERAGKVAPKWGSLHYHVSSEGRNLRELAGELNRLLLVRRINLGILNDVKGTGVYNYAPDLNRRGLLQMHGDNRIEFRAHYLTLEEELREISGLLAMDPAQAVEKVRGQVRAAFDSQTLDRILRNNPAFIENLQSYLRPDEKRLATSALLAALDGKVALQRAQTYQALDALGELTEPLRRRLLRDRGIFEDKDSLQFLNSPWFEGFVEKLQPGQRSNLQLTFARLLSHDLYFEIRQSASNILMKMNQVHPRAVAEIRRFLTMFFDDAERPLPLFQGEFFTLATQFSPPTVSFYKRLTASYLQGFTLPKEVLKKLRDDPAHAKIALNPEFATWLTKLMHSGSKGAGLLPRFVLTHFRENPVLPLEAAKVRFKMDPAHSTSRIKVLQNLAHHIVNADSYESAQALIYLKEIGQPDPSVLKILEEGLHSQTTSLDNLLNARDYLFQISERSPATEDAFKDLILRCLREWRKPGGFEIHRPVVSAAFGKALENKLANPAIFAEIQAIADTGLPGTREALEKLRVATVPAANCSVAFHRIHR